LNPQGEDYQQCKSCGKDLYDVERSELTMTSFRTGWSAFGRTSARWPGAWYFRRTPL